MRIIKKCCECQREYVDSEWRDANVKPGNDVVYSHGFCPGCYHKAVLALEHDLSTSLQDCYRDAFIAQEREIALQVSG